MRNRQSTARCRLPIGTRSLLFGAHQFALYTLFVALAWRRLYGRLPRDPRIWVAFVVHDLGYQGLGDMDGEEGQRHRLRGANLMGRFFDRGETDTCWEGHWWHFTGAHSHTFAALWDLPESPLMRPTMRSTPATRCYLGSAAPTAWTASRWPRRRRRDGTRPHGDADMGS